MRIAFPLGLARRVEDNQIMWMYLCLLLASVSAEARETDDFQGYYRAVPESTEVFDRYVQQRIDRAWMKSSGCDLDAFTEGVRKRLVNGSSFLGMIEEFAENDPSVKRVPNQLGSSIYADTPYSKSYYRSLVGLAPTVNVAGIKVGTDKIGHFIENGYYFQRQRAKGSSFNQLIQSAIDEEEGYLGWSTSGVKSYGDVAADLDGELFWANLAGRGPAPYFRCEGGKLVKQRDFHFAEYITAAWNEAINCNHYRGEDLDIPSLDALQLAVEALNLPTNSCDDYHEELRLSKRGEFKKAMLTNIARLEKENPGVRYTCPIEPGRCLEVRRIYEERFGVNETAKLISPECYAETLPKVVKKARSTP